MTDWWRGGWFFSSMFFSGLPTMWLLSNSPFSLFGFTGLQLPVQICKSLISSATLFCLTIWLIWSLAFWYFYWEFWNIKMFIWCNLSTGDHGNLSTISKPTAGLDNHKNLNNVLFFEGQHGILIVWVNYVHQAISLFEWCLLIR